MIETNALCAKQSRKSVGNSDTLSAAIMSREDELWHSVGRNPHCLQAVLNGSRQTELERELPFTRQLTPNSPALPYYRRRNESKTVIHWGQRKLLLSEMEFLNIYGHLSNLVVYAGAAPGTHMNYLIDAFPTHRFVCVDPARFSIRPNARVELRNELFTDEMAREFERARCLFICDIRSADSSNDNADDVEVHVEEDMMAQQQWHKLMRPVKSLLKFRLPWNPGATSHVPPLPNALLIFPLHDNFLPGTLTATFIYKRLRRSRLPKRVSFPSMTVS